MATYKLTLNGRAREVTAEPDTPLLWVLRDTLGMTGTKYGCGLGVCGACTIREGNDTVRSCTITIGEAAGHSYTTIEGLAAAGGRTVQDAWLEADVAQCGYCQPGMLMEASALLARIPKPSDPQIDDALGGHVCRCGTYQRIRRAIHMAAERRATGAK